MRALLYRCPGPHAGPPIDGKGTTYDGRGFDAADVDAAKAAGWCESLPEAAERFVRGAPVNEALETASNDEPSKAAPVVADAPLIVEPWAARVETSDLRTREIDDLKAIAKDLDGYDGRLGKEKLIALIEKARA